MKKPSSTSLPVDVFVKNRAIFVKIAGILHMRFLVDDFGSIQSWHYNDNYFIEIILKGQDSMRMEYDRRDLWANVLAGLEKVEW